jgi:peptidyl-prolyl cis-trans isomerase C
MAKKILVFILSLKKYKLALMIACGILLVVIILSFYVNRKNKEVVAVVNGHPVTVKDILIEMELSPESYKESLAAEPDAILESYVNQVLLFEEARRYERQLKNKIQERMKNHYIKELTTAYVETKLVEKIEITEEAVAEYYNSNLEDFVIPERVRLFEIVVSSQGSAENILRRLRLGESFEGIARRESISGSKERGGDLGWIDVRKLEPEISALVTRITPGDILANPIRSEVGYHIIELVGKTQKRMLTLQEAEPLIRSILLSQEKKREVDYLVSKLRERGNIRIFPDKMKLLIQNQKP